MSLEGPGSGDGKRQLLLFKVTDAAGRAKNLDELFRSVHEYLNELMKNISICIILYDAKKESLNLVYPANVNEKSSFSPWWRTLASYLIKEGKPLIATTELISRFAHEKAEALPAVLLGTPLRVKDKVMGVMCLFNYHDASTYSDEDLEMLKFVADQIAIAIERKQMEDALRESKEKYLSLMNDAIGSLSSGIIILDDHFRVVWVNHAIEEFFGIERDAIIGMDKRRLIKEKIKYIFEEPEKFERVVLSTYDNNTYIEQFECHVLPGVNRRERFLEHWSTPIRTGVFAGGRIEHYHDITARKRIEQRLAAQEKNLSLVFDNLLDGILIVDYDGRILKYNSVLAAMFEVEPEEMIGRNILELVAPESRDAVREILKDVRAGRGGHPGTYRVINRSGREFWVEWLGTDMIYEGRHVNLVSIRDITRRRYMEKELKEASEFLENVIDNIPDTITIKDSKHRLVMVNKAYCEITGLKKEEVIGKTVYRDKDEEVFQTKRVVNIPERTYTDRAGKRHYVSVKKAPLVNEAGEITHVLTISHDITGLKEAEKELEAKNKELEQFTYTVSHDLRAPLLTIQGFIHLLREDLKRNEQDKVDKELKYIEDAAKKMEKLLNDTLQLSRIGRVMNPPEEVPFGEIINEALEQTRQQIESSGVKITVADDFPVVHVDRMRIVEVLVNLITNSIKYMGDQPHPEIFIGYRKDDDEVVFFVRDNGIGIDRSQHEKVFELFYKLDSNTNGTGAGLAIVKKIIEVHGGRVWIESELGQGCTVCFTLPVAG
ncbi:MAG: hypothetical protein C4B56_01440 [Candidatus Methanophagaceae archaeon]|nr:MAG: hypothetical protein C4B56_01440 [Methanophagales archaeon]